MPRVFKRAAARRDPPHLSSIFTPTVMTHEDALSL
jgi:hypothetical protein